MFDNLTKFTIHYLLKNFVNLNIKIADPFACLSMRHVERLHVY